MNIENILFNGMRNPIGLPAGRFSLTFNVTDTESKTADCKIEISGDEDFSHTIMDSEVDPVSENVIFFNAKPRTVYYCRIHAEGDRGDCATAVARLETSKMNEPWTGLWIGCRPSFHPVLGKTFTVCGQVGRARLYICGTGLFQAFLNNDRIGSDYMSPGFCDYREKLEYLTYEVNGLIQGENRLEAVLGKGWYMGRFGLEGGSENNYGNTYQLICELHVDYTDGRHEVIASDLSWDCSNSGILDSGIYLGEIIDDNMRGGTGEALSQIRENRMLVPHIGPCIVEKGGRPVEKLIIDANNDCILDFGQNMAGYVEFFSDLEKGERITLEFAETLRNGKFYNGNYRTAESEFVFCSSGERRHVKPHFTYFGFRYCRVRGISHEKAGKMEFRAAVIGSDMERTGFFTTSNQKINRLYENALWSQISNFVDLPTDCPQRDERLGWTGDSQVFCPTACFNMDTRAFYRRFLANLRHDQVRRGGGIGNYIPSHDFLSGCAQAWGDAGTFIPDTLNRFYSNISDYEEEFRIMSDWVHWCSANMADETGLIRNRMQFGDWLGLDGPTEQSFKGGTDESYIASMYYYASAVKTMEMAKRLNLPHEEFMNMAGKTRKSILKEYFSPSGRLCIDTQTGYILALRFGVYVNKEKTVEGLKNRLEEDCYKIKCGFIGAPVLLQTLADNGLNRIAMNILLDEGYPGWLHCVRLGATTIWERWNSLDEQGNIVENGMNSLNHYSFGNVVQFLYERTGGIRPLEDGFKSAVIEPLIDPRIGSCRCEYRSIAGLYRIQWSITGEGNAHVQIEVPFGCRALVRLEGIEEHYVDAGKHVYEVESDHDLRCILDGDTLLRDLAANPDARLIIERNCPSMIGFSHGIENGALSLNRIMRMPYLGFDSETCGKIIDEISTVKVYLP